MQCLDIIKEILDNENLEYRIDYLPNGEPILIIAIKRNNFECLITIDEPIKSERIVRLVAIIANPCSQDKRDILEVINQYNQIFDFIKFTYENSSIGGIVNASYIIPPLEWGFQRFFSKVLNEFISVLDKIYRIYIRNV